MRPPLRAALVVPGDLELLTGGYIYDRHLLAGLRGLGLDVIHVALPASFPAPTAQDMETSFARLAQLPADRTLIIDGLAFGAMDPAGVAKIRAPIVALIHHPLALETGLAPDRAAALHGIEQANLAHAAQVIVTSPYTAALLSSDFGVPEGRIHIARPGTAQPAKVTESSGPERRPAEPPLILSVGIQLPRKGHDVLLRALGRITDLDWQAQIVGAPLDAPFAQHLRGLHRTLGLEGRVTLAGQLPQAAVSAHLRAAHVFALATRFEGYGIVFDEALAHGLPIVSCAVGAVPDTVPQAAGILVPPEDPEAFAQALRAVLEVPETHRRMSQAAHMAGAALPGWDDTAQIAARALRAATQTRGTAP